MAALRIHHHRVDRERVALPLPPQPLRPARHVGRVGAFQHQPLDRLGIRPGTRSRRVFPRAREIVPGVEGNDRREVEPVVRFGDEGGELLAPHCERQRSQVLAVTPQQVVGADMRGEFGDELQRDGAPVEPLLQHAEWLHEPAAHDE